MTNKHDIIWLDKVDSTNNEAKRRIDDIDNLSVLSASEQTSGRGQRGNAWSASAGENLTFSIIMKFDTGISLDNHCAPLPAYDQFAISEVAALSVVDFLAEHDMEARIKWPNDIYIGERKICGILIENSLKGDYLSRSIVGIGLNINQLKFDDSIPNPTSMAILTGKKRDLGECLEEFMRIFTRYVHRYLNIGDGLGKLRRLYLPLMWRKDEAHHYKDCRDGRIFTGTIRGLSEIGNLMIENEEGEICEYGFKEISYL